MNHNHDIETRFTPFQQYNARLSKKGTTRAQQACLVIDISESRTNNNKNATIQQSQHRITEKQFIQQNLKSPLKIVLKSSRI